MFPTNKHKYSDYFTTVDNSDIQSNERFKEKLDFLALTRERRESVGILKEIYLKNRDYLLSSFYNRLLQNEKFNTIIHAHSSVEKLKITFDRHFISLFDDELDIDYVFKRRQIAYTHARIGVLPNWMIAAYTLINQIIRPLIVKNLYKKQDKMVDVLLAYESLVTIDQQIIVETYIEIQANSVVTGLGDIISYNTKLESIKELVHFQRNQKHEIIETERAMQELDVSIEQIATTVSSLNEQTQVQINKMSEHLSSLKQVAAVLQATDEGQTNIQMNIEQLVKRVNNVTRLAEVIKGFAEQTNLLALSASIEAARAGDSGQGFAIVATDVRKLADDIKQSISTITTDIQQLLQITLNIRSVTSNLSEDLHKGVANTLHIFDTLRKLNESFHLQGQRLEEIVSATRHQSNAANTITEHNKNVTDNMEMSQLIVHETGLAIYQLSKMIDEFRTTTIAKNSIISQEDIIELAITDHLLWRWRIYNLLLGFEKISVDEVESPQQSRLGEWFYGKGKELLGHENAYKELEQPFVHIHEIAKLAVAEFHAGNEEKAEDYLEVITKDSQVVISKLRILQKIMQDKKSQYIH
ncbi:chemotaxis protein [Lysinibacillus sp. 2017]|uniref:protoglobin domain-containing protein n=1 Tax=unclassified Lysinibacillus TaxID=2636778 RepID=UPI000D525A59|nr:MULTISPECIES: protoglobin domain-containing protein [unclassified Lysinibacillus]AWE07597.1 chemotaxis protein [Lysinibacillus sp. 2017]TGN36760.1 chemotaxis protein [Lysinibacillus sp. S2017]